ncbi:hypothetical protein J6590_027919 [Homalodisca vitripennis]|nr:hypothetical protein J6590_027919 [Homalodisca vitripennis]
MAADAVELRWDLSCRSLLLFNGMNVMNEWCRLLDHRHYYRMLPTSSFPFHSFPISTTPRTVGGELENAPPSKQQPPRVSSETKGPALHQCILQDKIVKTAQLHLTPGAWTRAVWRALFSNDLLQRASFLNFAFSPPKKTIRIPAKEMPLLPPSGRYRQYSLAKATHSHIWPRYGERWEGTAGNTFINTGCSTKTAYINSARPAATADVAGVPCSVVE